MKGPAIELLNYEIQAINYTKELTATDLEGDSIKNVEIMCGLNDNLEYGQVIIKNTVVDKINDRKIKISVVGNYKMNPEYCQDEESAKKFLAGNGTAILYPYVRSIFSVITSLDNEHAIVLPTVNVGELLKENK